MIGYMDCRKIRKIPNTPELERIRGERGTPPSTQKLRRRQTDWAAKERFALSLSPYHPSNDPQITDR